MPGDFDKQSNGEVQRSTKPGPRILQHQLRSNSGVSRHGQRHLSERGGDTVGGKAGT